MSSEQRFHVRDNRVTRHGQTTRGREQEFARTSLHVQDNRDTEQESRARTEQSRTGKRRLSCCCSGREEGRRKQDETRKRKSRALPSCRTRESNSPQSETEENEKRQLALWCFHRARGGLGSTPEALKSFGGAFTRQRLLGGGGGARHLPAVSVLPRAQAFGPRAAAIPLFSWRAQPLCCLRATNN